MNNWFGVLSPLSKMMMAAVLVFFPVMVNVTRGLVQVEPAALELMRSYAASESEVLRKVRVPNALPYFFTALKLGDDAQPHRGDRRRVLRRLVARPRPDHRPERERPALRHHLGGDPPRGDRPGSCSTCRLGGRASSSSRGTRPVRPADVVGPPDAVSFRRSRSPRPTGMEEAPRGVQGRPCRESEIRPRPRGGAGDRAGRLHERRHAIAVGLRAGRVRTGLGPSRVGARVGSGVGIDRRTGNRPAPAPVDAAGPVRRLLRGRPAGLLRGREPDGPRWSRAAPTSIPQAVGSQPNGPEFTIAWVPKVLRPARPARISSTSPRSSSAPARCRCRGRTPRSTTRASSPARRSASGTSATSSRSRPAPSPAA